MIIRSRYGSHAAADETAVTDSTRIADLQARYLASEPQLMEITWRIAAMNERARELLLTFLHETAEPQAIAVNRAGGTLTFVAKADGG